MKLLLHIAILNSYPCLIIEREQFLMQMIFFVRLIIFFQYRRITRNVQGFELLLHAYPNRKIVYRVGGIEVQW